MWYTASPYKDYEGSDGEQKYTATPAYCNLSARSERDGDWATFRPICPWEKQPIHIAQEVGWVPGADRTVAENLADSWVRTQGCPASSESLYRLSYPDRRL